MESSNLHHHHQDQLVCSSSPPPPLATPSFYGLGINNHAWSSPTTLLNGGYYNPQLIINSNARDSYSSSSSSSSRQQNDIFAPSVDTPMTSSTDHHHHHHHHHHHQDLGLHWETNRGRSFIRNLTDSSHDLLHLGRIIKEEDHQLSLADMMDGTTASSIDDFRVNPTSYMKMMISGDEHRDMINSVGEYYSTAQGTTAPSRGNFSQIFPTVNISNLNQSSSSLAISSPLDMNLQALDLFNSGGGFCGSLSQQQQPNKNGGGLFKESNLSNYGHHDHDHDYMFQTSHKQPPNSPIKICNGGVTESKRPNSVLESKATQAPATKKSRLESRATCPPFKVRKEKLGDRIAALQQLVAPFGKTDTASVLMEAIGYIKFLQNQVETLSVPYMKSSSNKATRTMSGNDGSDELRRDLRSRGLCLVPLTCLSYVTEGGGVWPPPNFGTGT